MAKDTGEEREEQGGQEPPKRAVHPLPADPPKGQQGKENPARQRGTDDSFTGRAAQLAVMAELLWLRCNVAIPEVDLGTDVFVFKDEREEVVRLQVKSCTSVTNYVDESGYSAKFALPMKQFRRLDDRPPLYYALAVLRNGHWVDFIVVSRARLQTCFYGEKPFGSLDKQNDALVITVEFREVVECSGQILTDCRNAWKSLPPLQPVLDLDPMAADMGPPAEQADAGIPTPGGPGQT